MDGVGDKNNDLDDSGCVQDEFHSRNELELGGETQPESRMSDVQQPNVMDVQRVNLLDLSDDVLLCILKRCSPRDLKALGYTCPRLGSLVLDHTLWADVDMSEEQCGSTKLRWLTEHALNNSTKALRLCGLSKASEGCLGYVSRLRPMVPTAAQEADFEMAEDNMKIPNAAGVLTQCKRTQTDPTTPHTARQPAHLHIWSTAARQQPRYSTSTFLPSSREAEDFSLTDPAQNGCQGPEFTMTPPLLTDIRNQCLQIHTLHLEYANINCTITNLGQFPRTLQSLSLLGTKCFNMAWDSSFLTNIHNLLPLLEHVNVSECEWVDPSVLIPLSKLKYLKRLELRECHRLCEFIAYGSLAARYGFKQLESLDVRGSPLGESEVSPFAYTSTLKELYLSSHFPKKITPNMQKHAHYQDDPQMKDSDLESWEKEEPEYYKTEVRQGRASTPELEELPRNITSEIPHIRPSNIFTVTLSRNSAPVIEHIAPENLHQFLITQNMFAHENNPQLDINPREQDDFNRPHMRPFSPDDQRNARMAAAVAGEPPVKKQKTGEKEDGAAEQDDAAKQIGVVKPFGAEKPDENEDKNAVPLKKRKLNGVNNGASTSKNVNEGASTSKNNNGASTSKDNGGAPTSKDNGGASTSKDNGGASTSKDNGGASTFKGNGGASTSKDNGRASTSKDNGRASTSKDNGGASTSKDDESPSTSEDETPNKQEQRFVKFRRNKPPVVVSEDDIEEKREIWTRSKNKEVLLKATLEKDADLNEDKNMPIISNDVQPKKLDTPIDRNKEIFLRKMIGPPRSTAPVVKVDKGCDSLLREIKRSFNQSLANARQNPVEAERQNHPQQPEDALRYNPREAYSRPINLRNRIRMSYLSNLYYTPAVRPVDSTTMITDACIKTFGISDHDDINYVHIGPNGAFFVGRAQENGVKPVKSNLRKLVCTNYSGITNHSLDHLASAAPLMEYIDFSGTSVTKQGVEEFKSLRPDCVVIFDEDKQDED